MKKKKLLLIYLFFLSITIFSLFLFLLEEKNLNKLKSYVIDTKYEFFARKVYYVFKYGLSAYDDGEIFYLNNQRNSENHAYRKTTDTEAFNTKMQTVHEVLSNMDVYTKL